MRSIFALMGMCTLAACSGGAPENSTVGEVPAKSLGLERENFDPSVRPQDDFYQYVNGGWLNRTEIPADKSEYGSFSELRDRAEASLRTIIEAAADQKTKAPGSDAQKIGDFYLSYMDEDRREQLGLDPLAGELEAIASADDLSGISALMGRFQLLTISTPFALFVNPDFKATDTYIVYVTQFGLGLPDRDYYLNEDEKFAEARTQYVAYATRLLELAGIADATDKARALMALETRMAEIQWPRVKNRDRVATYNKREVAALNEMVPGFDWAAFMAAASLAVDDVIVRQPSYLEAFGPLFADTPVDLWRTYLQVRLLDDFASVLTSDFVDANFDFHGRAISGIAENRPLWKRAVSATDSVLPEVLGRLYVERNFPPEAKTRMEGLVANLMRTFRQSIDDLAWMGPETKQQAQAKLSKFVTKIAYPDKWKDYSDLIITADDLVGNVMRSRAVESRRELAKLGNPVDRNEWLMTPHTVNAYYNPPMNEIVFPAAILQPPFFDLDADDATNYGAIGAVIGHEISHGFDDQGRRTDGDGILRDWWTPEDEARFKERAAKLVDQFSGYSPVDGLNVNGELTLGENIGDLSGLTVAYRAYRLSLDGKDAPVIDGFTGDQRFFMGWAQIWRRLYRDEELRRRLLVDPHSPSRYRVNGIVSNLDWFHQAFETKPSDPMYRAPEDRISVW